MRSDLLCARDRERGSACPFRLNTRTPAAHAMRRAYERIRAWCVAVPFKGASIPLPDLASAVLGVVMLAHEVEPLESSGQSSAHLAVLAGQEQCSGGL